MFFTEYPQTRHWYKAAEKAIYWPNGAITEFSYLKSTDDVFTYQGREYEDISIDEITQHEELVFKILRGSNRTVNPDIKPTMLLTGNPGGIGHGWVKRIFIDRDFIEDELPGEFDFIQAKVYDNKALMRADPDYLKRLQDLPANFRRAYLEGDWDIFSGQVFDEFRREKHVIEPVIPKPEFPHFLGSDWGYSDVKRDSGHKGSFASLASALIKVKHQGVFFHRVITYKEWYGWKKSAKTWATEIYRTSPRNYKRAIFDSSMFNPQSDGSNSIADRMKEQWKKLHKRQWVTLERGTRNRVASIEAIHNWLKIAPDGLPYWLITENCRNLIRTLPLMVYDDHNPDDWDKNAEDHLPDVARYKLSYIKYIPAHLGAVSPKDEQRKRKAMKPIVHKLDLGKFEKAKEEKKKGWPFM